MSFALDDPSCHPSIPISVTSPLHTLAFRGRRGPELALSLHNTRIPTEERGGPPRGPKSLKQSVIHQAGLSGDIRGKGRKGMNTIREGEVTGCDRNKQWEGETEKEAD